MKIALISDIHGNLPALEACLSALARLDVDQIYFLGDAVGYFPDEIPVLQRLLAEGCHCQKGNHEAMLLEPTAASLKKDEVYRLNGARQRLRDTPLWPAIAHWPDSRAISVESKRFLLVHGSPRDELFGYVYPDTDLAPFAEVPYDAVVMANTHHPCVRTQAGKCFVNIGSVGLPRDQGNLAAFAIYDSGSQRFQIMRVTLDVERIMAAYGKFAAPETLQCLRRQTDSPVGEILS